MKFHIVDEIPYERELVFSTHRDKLLELVPYFGNIDKIEVPSRDEEDGIVRFENMWYGKSGDIPAPLRPILSADRLKWLDRAEWDENNWRCQWEIEIPVLPGAITARGMNRFRDEGGETVIEMNGEFIVHADKVPGIPTFAAKRILPILERFIVAQLEPNLRNANRAVERYIDDNL